MNLPVPSKPEAAPPEIHPKTLEMLKVMLPTCKKIVTLYPESNPVDRRAAADEFRENFPAVVR